MQQRGLVILTPIKPGQVDVLRQLLRSRIDPIWDAQTGQQICRAGMPFDRLHMLHFACIAVLDEDGGDAPMDPCLLFEATIDGAKGDFLDELITLCGPGLDLIYSHCEGYPASGVALPHLVKSYLGGHDVVPSIQYQGHPGRTISEIRGEDGLRLKLLKTLEGIRQQTADLPITRTEILHRLRRAVIAPPEDGETDGDTRWATEKRAEPIKTRWGRILVVLAAAAFGLLVAGVGIWVSAPNAAEYFLCMNQPLGPDTGCRAAFANNGAGTVLVAMSAWPFQWGGWLLSLIAEEGELFWTAAAAVASWLTARGLQYLCETQTKPGNAGTGWLLLQAARWAAVGLRAMALVAIIGFGLTNLGSVQIPNWIAYNLAGAVLTGALVLLVGLPALLFLRYIRTMPSLDSSFGHATAARRAWLSLASDTLWLVMAILTWLLLVAANWVTGYASHPPGMVFMTLVTWGVSGTLSVLFLLALASAAVVLWLLSIGVREQLFDNRSFEDATVLTDVAVDASRFAREGHGVNKVQNHLISVSRIKPGRLRLLRLRFVTFVVNQMCVWWFTRGELGDVRDIHFLRWIIIDRGRRLLFLDTYQGSWSGYLDAFIDSGSVHGLNAIWSHTYQYVRGVPRPVGFPRTECMLLKGARDERPFKAAVRASQKETTVWYSAYPGIGGVNIITNSRIRDDLFRPLDTAETDRLISTIR
ncbi:hypothetical protein LCL97_01095 [Seohaeicola saemankumensis]|nr:hypothetical protein [Seohaeicola saemankumensis]MCA0869407.1 hypothetical protein [Seohaeicola saemankumensis]